MDMTVAIDKLKELQDILSAKYDLEMKISESPKRLSNQKELVARLKKEFIEKVKSSILTTIRNFFHILSLNGTRAVKTARVSRYLVLAPRICRQRRRANCQEERGRAKVSLLWAARRGSLPSKPTTIGVW